jgi:hypothetical protein
MAAMQDVPFTGGVGGATPASESSSPIVKEYEILIEVVYRYEPGEEEPFQATVYVFIETEDGSNEIPFLLRFYNATILASKLTSTWGIIKEREGKKYKYDYYYYASDSWEKLEEKINETIRKIEETLREVKNKNIENLIAKPKDFSKILKI